MDKNQVMKELTFENPVLSTSAHSPLLVKAQSQQADEYLRGGVVCRHTSLCTKCLLLVISQDGEVTEGYKFLNVSVRMYSGTSVHWSPKGLQQTVQLRE
ncbi:hypothetical protein M514_23861, partial [Trichuris suis]